MDDLSIAELSVEQVHEIQELNQRIFGETRLVQHIDHPGLLVIGAYMGGELIGFKVGYPKDRTVFYSAKGAVDPNWRRKGVARRLLHFMMSRVYLSGFDTLQYHTFPNRDPGMLVLGLQEGFKVIDARYNAEFKDWQVELSIGLKDVL
jgi:predicted GNAT superfamily acetyltransferase